MILIKCNTFVNNKREGIKWGPELYIAILRHGVGPSKLVEIPMNCSFPIFGLSKDEFAFL